MAPFIFIYFFCLFRALPLAYGSSQARGQITGAAAGLPKATATPDPSCICNLHHISRQSRILDPLSETRDRTRNLIVSSQIHFCCATMGTPIQWILIKPFTYQVLSCPVPWGSSWGTEKSPAGGELTLAWPVFRSPLVAQVPVPSTWCQWLLESSQQFHGGDNTTSISRSGDQHRNARVLWQFPPDWLWHLGSYLFALLPLSLVLPTLLPSHFHLPNFCYSDECKMYSHNVILICASLISSGFEYFWIWALNC